MTSIKFNAMLNEASTHKFLSILAKPVNCVVPLFSVQIYVFLHASHAYSACMTRLFSLDMPNFIKHSLLRAANNCGKTGLRNITVPLSYAQ